MSERSVRLIVSDDLKRGRGSVFFRIWFAIPFLIWLALWAIAAFFVAIASWATTLMIGQPPEPLHRFLSRFVRFATHANAYLYLAAQPLPSFDGEPGYPIDVEIDPPTRQNRWGVLVRIVLALPALLLVTVIAGLGVNSFGNSASAFGRGTTSLLAVASFLAWFFALARSRLSRGLRDLIAYTLSYAAQFWAYLLLLTDRYPSSDPRTAIGPLPRREDPIRLVVLDELRRSRLTVFFRLPLAFPHLVWLTLWGIVAVLAAIVNWLATLIAGRSPAWLHRFLSAYLRYQLDVGAFLYLVGNPFPGFTGAEETYPVALYVGSRARQNRWTVLFRIVLALPALVLARAFSLLLVVIAVLGWFAALATGRMPLGLRNAGAFALRYTAQTNAYLFMLTDAYPYSGPCISTPPAPAVAAIPEVAPPPPYAA